ncbi:mitochondrial 54S ribosomal protein L40 [Anaerobacillus alkaliphilus]|uniref:Mitochondrial 54S ribosomal protein L40 n=1 Tax=Anaerobacillus alkaliphilus TaxID=1548597 RepID=A0A4Q0VMG3_9BACI|nr:DUF2187 family protein [Anaerobacillus alkaliphilus]RXI96541.1 mitochondrial 54S ribosomal protein L40 [Anaerobacillus alkaliphilus]
MSEEITVQPGDAIQITAGDFKGEKGTIIGVYNNSSSIELDTREENDKPRKTVVQHKNYKKL